MLNCTFTVYAPRIFSNIIEKFDENKKSNHIDFTSSLNIESNADKIRQIAELSEGQGGKSGEFFFLTHDRKLILKTTNTKEAGIF